MEESHDIRMCDLQAAPSFVLKRTQLVIVEAAGQQGLYRNPYGVRELPGKDDPASSSAELLANRHGLAVRAVEGIAWSYVHRTDLPRQ
jgi:hypothetical protein